MEAPQPRGDTRPKLLPCAVFAAREGADFAFGSLRKWLPLPDGGFAEAENPSEIFARPASSIPDFSADFLAASAARSRGSGWEEFAEKLFYAAEAKISARKSPAEWARTLSKPSRGSISKSSPKGGSPP